MKALLDRSIVRFAIVGVCVAGIYVLGYLTLLEFGLARPIANIAAFLFAVLIQYFAQTIWTFRKSVKQPRQAAKFVVTITLGILVSIVVTARIGPMLGWADWLSAGVVATILPIQNYIIFKVWVYRPSKSKPAKSQSE